MAKKKESNVRIEFNSVIAFGYRIGCVSIDGIRIFDGQNEIPTSLLKDKRIKKYIEIKSMKVLPSST